MKLLFDHNLSPRLVDRLTDIYPGARHIYLLGLDRALDDVVWNYAHEEGYVIVTCDVDFSELSVVRGFPPKVVWIRRGNCSTREIEEMLRLHSEAIKSLDEDPNLGILALF